MKSKVLKPCPFCGGEGGLFIDKYAKYFAGCSYCGFYYGIEIEDGVELQDGWRAVHDTEEDAADAWNTRKPIEDIVERLELEEQQLGYCETEFLQGGSDGLKRAIEIVKKGCSE